MPRWAPLSPSLPLSATLVPSLFPPLSEIMCGVPFHPSPSPSHHLAVRSRRGGSGCQTRSLRSQLLCHAADKTSMHISLKEREDLRDFRSLSLSSFLEIPLFVHLPSPPFFFCISHSLPPTLQCIVYISRRQFPSKLQTFPATIWDFLFFFPCFSHKSVWNRWRSSDTEGHRRRGSIKAQRAAKQQVEGKESNKL